MFFNTAVLLAGGLALAGMCSAASLSSEQRDLNVKSFEVVWSTVRDAHWDPNMGGLDWKAAHDEFLPKVQQAETMDGARKVITAMLERLGASHYGIIPTELYSSFDTGTPEPKGGSGSPGVECTVIDGKAVVKEVLPESPAASAGVRPGWIIQKIDNAEPQKLIADVYESKAAHAELLAQRAIRWRLQGRVGEPVAVTFLNGTDKQIDLKLDRVRAPGTVTTFGLLPPMLVWLENKRLDGNIGYIRFNQFLDPQHIMKQFEDGVLSCLKCRGMIIDLRGNTGGIGVMAMGMAGFFTDRSDLKLGTMIMRQTKLKFIISPRPQTFTGPLAMLVDGVSASTAEIFAGGLQDLKRARVFGTQSAGAALPSVIRQLPNGDGFQYAQANYISEGGQPLEGRGVTPDVKVTQSREALLHGHDRVIDAAVEWIKGQHD